MKYHETNLYIEIKCVSNSMKLLTLHRCGYGANMSFKHSKHFRFIYYTFVSYFPLKLHSMRRNLLRFQEKKFIISSRKKKLYWNVETDHDQSIIINRSISINQTLKQLVNKFPRSSFVEFVDINSLETFYLNLVKIGNNYLQFSRYKIYQTIKWFLRKLLQVYNYVRWLFPYFVVYINYERTYTALQWLQFITHKIRFFANVALNQSNNAPKFILSVCE